VDRLSFSKRYHNEDTAYKLFLEAKINLNSLDSLKKLGWMPGTYDNGYVDDILCDGRIIITGYTTDSIKYDYNEQGIDTCSIWEFKVDKILKGAELMNFGDKEGSTIFLKSVNTKSFSYSAEISYVRNTNYILYIKQYQSYPKTNPPRSYHTGFGGKMIIDNGFVYGANWYRTTISDLSYREKHRISFEYYLDLVKKVLEVNDSKNFYKRSYK
jgi:hypothetical protein